MSVMLMPVVASTSCADDKYLSSRAIVNDTVCYWNEDLDECFCVSHVAVRPTITWAPAEACGVYGAYELDCETECDCNEVAK